MADISPVAANVVKYDGAEIAQGTAGETVTQGMTVYKKAADGLLWKADCTSAAEALIVGVSLNSALAGQPITYLKSGGLNPGAAVVVGTTYGVTDTGGGISDIADRGADDFITLLGIATTTSRIEVDINASGIAIAGA